MRSRGFTLVEMLVALTIFGMITAAGVALLTLTARTQETAERLLGELGELRRAGALIGADLAQAAPRPYRDRDGEPRRAFAGGPGGEGLLIVLVRRASDAEDLPTVQRVAWRLRGGRLERLAFPAVDGGGEPQVATLMEGVNALRLRYRDEDGAWLDRWQPSDAARLPTAVELVTESAPHGLVRQLFAVGADGR